MIAYRYFGVTIHRAMQKMSQPRAMSFMSVSTAHQYITTGGPRANQ